MEGERHFIHQAVSSPLHILYGHLAAEVQELEGVFNGLLAVHLAKGIDVSVIPGVRLGKPEADPVDVGVGPAGKACAVDRVNDVIRFAVHHVPVHIGELTGLHDPLEFLILSVQ